MKRISLVPVAYAAAILGAAACGGPATLDAPEDENIGDNAAKLGAFNVLTRSYNVQRTGANTSESTLTVANVSGGQFGRRFQMSVDDQVYAGLLYASSVSIGGNAHNVLYVATMNNSVYAFDADTGAVLWQKNFNGAGRPLNHNEVGISLPTQDWCNPNYNDISGKIGIMGTPVIDAAGGTIYFVSRTVTGTPQGQPNPASFKQQLNALDLTTGNARAGSPKDIVASVSGTGDGSSGGNLAFNPRMQNQRAALALNGSTVYIAWSGHCDVPPYHGWVMAYNKDLSSTATPNPRVFVTTPNGNRGGIWQSGGGPLIDASGNLYFATGNGGASRLNADTTDPSTQPALTNGMVKLSSTLGLQSSFVASDWLDLNGMDMDLGSGGPSFVPFASSPRIFTGGKDGNGYLFRDDLSLAQKFQVVFNQKGSTKHVHSSSTYWQSPQGLNMYVWGENDVLHVYRFNTSSQTFGANSVLNGPVLSPVGIPGGTAQQKGVPGMPGGFMALSANNSTAGTGILWATIPFADANHATSSGTFRAFNAETLAQIFDSGTGSNGMGNLAKYNPPLVAQGRVYVPSFSNTVSVYGLPAAVPQSPFNGTPVALPNRIEAENYDLGGEGVAYHDTEATNQGNAGGNTFRTNEGVDIENTMDSSGSRNVGWVAAGEWLEYAVSSPSTTNYTVTARIASMAAGNMSVQVDGGTASTIFFGNTGDWQMWQTTAGITLPVSQGNNHILRVTLNSPCNFNWIDFATTGGPTPTTYSLAADTYGRSGASAGINCNTATACGSATANELEVKNTGVPTDDFNRETYIRFTGVNGTTASNATLHLCVLTTDTDNPGVNRNVVIEGIANDTWAETTLNFGNRPTDTGQNPVTQSFATDGSCRDINVTTFVSSQLQAPDHAISFRVRAADSKRTAFANRSAASGFPTLTVTN